MDRLKAIPYIGILSRHTVFKRFGHQVIEL